MTHAYAVTPDRRDEIVAGSHPRDRTIRPQVVTERANPQYHRLISEFKNLTGRGAVLNTSFNIHGEPIVMTAVEAVDVMKRSGLEFLLFRQLISRVSPAEHRDEVMVPKDGFDRVAGDRPGIRGLPLAQAFSRAGLAVVGLDTSEARVDHLAAGGSPIDDLSDADIARMLEVGFAPTTDAAALESVDAIVICVPTPLGPAVRRP